MNCELSRKSLFSGKPVPVSQQQARTLNFPHPPTLFKSLRPCHTEEGKERGREEGSGKETDISQWLKA